MVGRASGERTGRGRRVTDQQRPNTKRTRNRRKRAGDRALGDRIRRFRVKIGMSQRAAAQWIDRSEGWLIQVEMGRADPGYGDLVNLATIFNVGISDLIPGHQSAADSLPPLKADDLRQPVTLDRVELLRRDLADLVTGDDMTTASIEDWEATVLRLGRATRDRPAGLLLNDLTVDLLELRRALARCRSASAVRRLTCVAAQTAGLMCLTLIKLDERTAFRRWARTARTASDEAGDPLTSSWVRAHEAYGHYYAGDLTYAVDVARHAQELAGSVPCVGSALAAALEARAHAALGRADETRMALKHAEQALQRLPSDATVPSAFGYNEAQLRFHAGNAHTHLRDTASAWREQERALQLCPPDDYMDRALTRLDRAVCLIREGDVSGASAYAMTALSELSEEQRTGIIAVRARSVVAALPARTDALPAARDLHELILEATKNET